MQVSYTKYEKAFFTDGGNPLFKFAGSPSCLSQIQWKEKVREELCEENAVKKLSSCGVTSRSKHRARGGTQPMPGERTTVGVAMGSMILALFYAWRQRELVRALKSREAQALLAREAQALLAVAGHSNSALISGPGGPDGGQPAQPRSWNTHLVGLDKMISELLCEARLLAAELNKHGDISAIMDPLAPTVTAERRLTAQPETDAIPTAGSEREPSEVSLQRERSGREMFHKLRETLGSFAPGKLRTKVIGVCGMSCSGKSTVSSVLRLHAARYGAYVPVICLDDSYHAWMDEPPSREQPTNVQPAAALGTRAWKSWESSACVHWQQFLDRLQAKLEVHYGYTPLILIEGFLLLEDETVARTCQWPQPPPDPTLQQLDCSPLRPTPTLTAQPRPRPSAPPSSRRPMRLR